METIEFTPTNASQTLSQPVITTTHLVNQSPNAKLVGEITLYFELIGTPSIEVIVTPAVDINYGAAVAQGIQNSLDPDLTGLRIWWCHWRWHPNVANPRTFTRAAAIATTQILPWLSPTDFIPGPETQASTIVSISPQTIFKHNPISSARIKPLHPPAGSRWTLKTPLISHITQIRDAHFFSPNQTTQNQFIEAQTTLSFKSIANTQRVCPVDKLPQFHRENGEIFNNFADIIYRQIPNARGFDVMIQQMTYGSDNRENRSRSLRRTNCLAMLTAALQQAINIRSHSY